MERPDPSAWAEKITPQEFERFAPARLELVDGNILAAKEARLDLLAVLLKNCGLEAAAFLCDKFDWHDAADRAGHNM